MPRSQCEKENIQLVQELAEVDGPFESPINLNYRDLIKLDLPSLTWNKPDAVPKKMKITNTGHTVIISGKWKSERPYLTGGPLDGKYVFSQIHFHWGPDNCKGSEHQVCGESFPLEMHVAHFKTEYMTQEAALREKDGMVVLVYLFKLQPEPNNSLKKIIHALPCIRQANTSQPMENRSILALCNPFTDDYFMYWGSVVTSTCAHILLWIVCREPFGISPDQVEEFRKIMDSSDHPIRRNSRDPQPLHKRNVFHVNPSRNTDEPMLPVRKIMGCFCGRTGLECDSEHLRRPEGDGFCSCHTNYGPQEEFEGRQITDCNQQTGISRGNGMYMQQTVYYHHATVQSVPTLPRDFAHPTGDPEEARKEQNPREGREISQSCCFLSMEEEKSAREERMSREKTRSRRRRPIDSVTTLTNLIETLETLKMQTYRKLKEIETINSEIRGMKSSCDNLQDKNWLRHAEKIMSRQKRFTIRSSQCCFSELKKLAKECNFDKLLDDKMIAGVEDGKALVLSTTEATDSALMCSNASGDKTEFTIFDNNRPFSVYNQERFSRKSQKLIRSFFEDIKETEEAQMNIEKNLVLKKFEKLSMRSSEHSNASSINFVPGRVHITKKMMNMGRIRNQFFTEVPSEEKVIVPTQPKTVSSGKKKKKRTRSFFKIRLGGFENEKPIANKKLQKRSLFTRSAFSWLNNRFSTGGGSSPFITLRLRDIDLKSGAPSAKKKSKQSVKNPATRKVISDEHVRTEVSSFMSESIVSEITEKPSRYSKQRIKSTIQEGEKNSRTGRKSDLSLVKLVKDMDTNKFFIEMDNSTNMSSATSTATESRSKKFRKRRSRKDLWQKSSSAIFHKGESKSLVDNEKVEDAKGGGGDKKVSISTDSSSVIQESKPAKTLSCQSSKSFHKSKDVGLDVTESQTISSPRRKKLRLEGKKSSDSERSSSTSQPEEVKPELGKASYVESECQADFSLKLSDDDPNLTVNNEGTSKTSQDTSDRTTVLGFSNPKAKETESQTESDKEMMEKLELQKMKDTSVGVNIPMPTLLEDTSGKDGKPGNYLISENEASEASLLPRKSSDTMSESKSFAFEIQPQKQDYWISKFPNKEKSPIKDLVVETEARNLVSLEELTKGEEESSLTTDAERQVDMVPKCSGLTYIGASNILEDSSDRGKAQLDTTQEESRFTNMLTTEECVEVSREASQNELTDCNDYDFQTDSNGTMVFNVEKEMQSRDSTLSIPSSEDEKRHNKSLVLAASAVNIHSQQKPFSADSLNSFKNTFDGKPRKRRQCIRKKSRPLVRKSNAMMRKLNKIGGSNLDFTNLTEEEQLKIISANVAKFVKQKLVEHKHFFDFGKSDTTNFDVEEWSRSAELELNDVPDGMEVKRKWEKEANEEEEMNHKEMVSQSVPKTVPPPLPPMDEEIKETVEEPKSTVESSVLSPAGDTEKVDKGDLRRQTLDFVKLNKIMAGKYKRRTPQEATPAKVGIKKLVKKEEKKERPKTPITKIIQEVEPAKPARPLTPKKAPMSQVGKGDRVSSTDSGRRGASLQRGGKSDIPVAQTQSREPPKSPRLAKINSRSASASPQAPVSTPKSTPTSPLALPKPKPPKKRLIPTYTLTSYLPAPIEVMNYQQRELDKYLTHSNNITDFFLDNCKDRKYKRKKNRDLSQKNLDYLIMLQKRINHEISANIENSMNYVQTLLNQDYNGTAIIEKAPVKNSLDMFDPGASGILLIEVNDQLDYSSSSSEESGFYCIYQGRNRLDKKSNVKREFIVKRNESGDSGLFDSRLIEELHDTDSSYSCEVSILVGPEEEKRGQAGDVSDVLKKYIYHLGGGEETDSGCMASDALIHDEVINPKPHLKKRRDRVLDLPKEMKRKLLDVLEDEMRESAQQGPGSGNVSDVDEELNVDEMTKKEEGLEAIEIMSKISEMVKQYLNEYDVKQPSDDGQEDEIEDFAKDESESRP